MRAYESMLSLYPRAYRDRFGGEMLQVFDEVRAAMAHENPGARLAFYLSEFRGLLLGAASERIRALGAPHGFEFFGKRSLYMQPERKFPYTSIAFMSLALGIIVLTIVKAQGIAYYMQQFNLVGKDIRPNQLGYVSPFGHSLADWPSHWGLLASIALFFVITWLAAVTAWGVAHALKRSGVHRLDEAQTWPQPR
jgi:hypothetical protein